MPNLPSALILQKIAASAHVPAVGYVYVEPKDESKHEFVSTSLTAGKKNIQSTDVDTNRVNEHTQFPASSLSKIVFTYLVLQLVKAKKFDLDEKLHDILKYERFLVNGKYPEKATQLTARHIFSHAAGLPNFGPNSNLSSTLSFDDKSKLGEGYSYSGEAFLYLQKVVETKMTKELGEKVDLENLARKYVFDDLGMDRSTFMPPTGNDTNIVTVHTELEKPTSIYICNPPLNGAASLFTTTHDFSKFMVAWLKNMDDPIFKQAFKPTNVNDFPTCGLGWHIYRNKNEVIAYQYGQNPNTRSFMAINVTTKKGAAFFTNSENGMSIANQLLSPIGNLQAVFQHMNYKQSDEPGWQETLAGKIAEDKGMSAKDQGKLKEARDYFEEARSHFDKALTLAPEDKSKQWRLKWFDEVHQPNPEKQKFTQKLEQFVGKSKNDYNDEIDINIKKGGLVCERFGREIKLVRISETDFLPEQDQSIRIRFNRDQVSILSVDGDVYLFPSPKPKERTSSYDDISGLLGDQQPVYEAKTPVVPPDKNELETKKPIEVEQKKQDDPIEESKEVNHLPQFRK